MVKSCGILEEYCQFIEIVERTYNKQFPKTSFRKAIEQAMKEGILTDYLDRKSREVINMLCAKYDYKMDIAVKKEEAFQDGMQQKAIEDAKNAIAIGLTPEQIHKITGLSLEQIIQLKKETANA